MHENRFEKQVREKMDQLQFDPLEAVWTSVDLEINKDKKRRRPMFWLFFFSGIALVSGAYFFGHNRDNPVSINKTRQNTNDQKLPAQRGSVSRNEKLIGRSNADHLSNSDHLSNANHVGNTAQVGVQFNKPLKAASAKQVNSSRQRTHLNEEHISDETANEGMPDNHQVLEPSKLFPAGDQGNNKDSSSVKKTEYFSEAEKKKTDTVAETHLATEKKKQTKSHKWQLGFDATGGFSKIQQSLFKSGGTNPSYSSYSPGGLITGAGYGPPSEITAGFSFGAGVFVKKNLSKRFSFSAGLDYQYYSTKIRTGDHFAPSSGSYANSYYVPGNLHGYTNRYRFITMPLSISFQLNKSRRLPVSLIQTASISYLLNSHVLYYDPTANIYYKNNQALNKTQVRMATAILVGFPFQHSAMAIGPQIQYGLTGLLKKGYGGSEQLFYGGLTFTFVPGKK